MGPCDAVTTLDVEDGKAVVRFGGLQAVMALARQVSVPLEAVTAVEVVRNGWDLDLGWRVGGTGIPRRLAFGRYRSRKHGRTFAGVYCGEPAVVLTTTGGDWDRIAVAVEDAEAAAARVRKALEGVA